MSQRPNSPILVNLFRLYLYSLPFIFALSFRGGTITLSLIIALALSLVLLVRLFYSTLQLPPFLSSFILLGIFLGCLSLGLVLNDPFSSKPYIHLLAYSSSILLFGLIPLTTIANIDLNLHWKTFANDFINVVRFCCVIAIVEFVASNFFDIYIKDFIFFPDSLEGGKSRFLGLFFRSRGFASEPGHFAFLLETMIPLSLACQRSLSKQFAWVSVADMVLFFLAFLVIGSPAAIAIFFMGFIIAALFFSSGDSKKLILSFTTAVAAVAIIVSFLGRQIGENLNLPDVVNQLFVEKVDSSSADVRDDRSAVGSRLFHEATPLQTLVGYGPAVYATKNLGEATIIQLYQLLLLESGLLGLGFFLGSFLVFARNAYAHLGTGKMFFFWSMINCFTHYAFISNYYYPIIWLYFSLAVLFNHMNPAPKYASSKGE